MDEKVTPTHWEFWRCVQVANLRMAVANSRGMNHAISTHRPLLQRLREEVIGACGECAVAKYLGRYWAPLEELDRFHDVPDVLPNIEVRSTHHDKGKLTMYPTDKRDRIYICVTGEPPNMTIRGYRRGAECFRDEWKVTPEDEPGNQRNIWRIPQSELHPIPDTAKLSA